MSVKQEAKAIYEDSSDYKEDSEGLEPNDGTELKEMEGKEIEVAFEFKEKDKDKSKIYDDDCKTDEHLSKCEFRDFQESSEDNDGENRNLPENKKISTMAITVTMINSIVGTGIINLPFIYKSLGIILATFSIFLSGFISTNSVYFLMRTKIYTHRYSYALYAKLSYGTIGTIALRIVFVMKNICSCCVRLRVFGNLSQSLMMIFLKISRIVQLNDEEEAEPTQFFLTKNFYILVIFCLLMPLMFKNDVSALKKFNFLGCYSVYFFVSALVIVSVYKYFKNELPAFESHMLYPTISPWGIVSCVTALFDAFSFHANIFPIYLTMKDRTARKMSHCSIEANLVTACLYVISGMAGFFMFRLNLNKDVFRNFKNDILSYRDKNIFISLLLFCSLIGFFISALLSFPLVFFSLKNNLYNFFMLVKKKMSKNEKDKKRSPLVHLKNKEIEKEFIEEMKEVKKASKEREQNCWRKYVYTFCCYCLVLFLTLNVDSVIALNSLAGSTFGNVINILAPALFLLHFSKAGACSYEKIAAKFSFIVSIVTFIWWGINLKK